MCSSTKLSRDLSMLILVGLSAFVSTVLSEVECVTSTYKYTTTRDDTYYDITLEITFHVTPFWNGTTKTSTEYHKKAGVWKGGASTMTSVTGLTSPGFFNISKTSTTAAQRSCTYTTTLTVITSPNVIGTVPGRTYTSATTLFDCNYVSPPLFQPPEVTTTIAMISFPDVTLSAAPTAAPNTPTITTEPGETRTGLPTYAYPDRSESISGKSGQPTATQIPNGISGNAKQENNLPLLSLPGIGSALVDPSRTAVFLPGPTNALAPGDHTTINGVPISFDSSGSFVIVNGQKIAIPAVVAALTHSPLVVDGHTIPIVQLAAMLTPGQITTVNNMRISLSSDSSMLLIGSEIIPLDSTGWLSASVIGGTTYPIVQVASGLSLMPSGVGILLPNGQTLRPGQVTTFNGIPISLSPSEGEVIIAGSTVALPKSPTGNLGSSLSTGVASSVVATSELPHFSGAACERVERVLTWMILWGILVCGLMEWL